jgi:hypothetical protein
MNRPNIAAGHALAVGCLSWALIASANIALSSPAMAQEQKAGAGFERTCHELDAKRERRVAYFGNKLHISPSQSDIWNRFRADTKGASEPIAEICRKYLDAAQPTRLPDRMERLAIVESAKAEALRRQAKAVAELYDRLSSEQRIIADNLPGFGGEE